MQSALSSGNAFPTGAFAACALVRFEAVGKVSLLAASLLFPSRVARVSRLIGKSDTTAIHPGLQVRGTPHFQQNRFSLSQIAAKRQNATPKWSGVLLSCAGHWPPKSTVDGGCLHRAYCRLSRPVSRFIGGCSCRASAVLWAVRTFIRQPVHHWHPLFSN